MRCRPMMSCDLPKSGADARIMTRDRDAFGKTGEEKAHTAFPPRPAGNPLGLSAFGPSPYGVCTSKTEAECQPQLKRAITTSAQRSPDDTTSQHLKRASERSSDRKANSPPPPQRQRTDRVTNATVPFTRALLPSLPPGDYARPASHAGCGITKLCRLKLAHVMLLRMGQTCPDTRSS